MDRKYYIWTPINTQYTEVELVPFTELECLQFQMNEHDFYQINKGSKDARIGIRQVKNGPVVAVPIDRVSYQDYANRLYPTSVPELKAIGERAGRTYGQLTRYNPDQLVAVDALLMGALQKLQGITYEIENHWMAWKAREARAKRIEELEANNNVQ